MTDFSQTLKAVRLRLGKTQAEMADFLKLNKNYVSILERGEKEPSESLRAFVSQIDTQTPSATPRENIRVARKIKGLSVKELAKATGYSIGVLQALEDGGARISRKLAEKLAKVLEIEVSSILDGTEHPSQTHVGNTPDVHAIGRISLRYVPLISMAQAGELTDYTDEIYDYEGQLAVDVKDSKAFAIKIRGDSMSPEFPEGTVVIVAPSIIAQNGHLVIARLASGGVVFKRLQRNGAKFQFISSNPSYPVIEAGENEVTWCYPVDQVIRKML